MGHKPLPITPHNSGWQKFYTRQVLQELPHSSLGLKFHPGRGRLLSSLTCRTPQLHVAETLCQGGLDEKTRGPSIQPAPTYKAEKLFSRWSRPKTLGPYSSLIRLQKFFTRRGKMKVGFTLLAQHATPRVGCHFKRSDLLASDPNFTEARQRFFPGEKVDH